MTKQRKIVVSIATSADGYIARPDGDVAWLDRPRPKGNYGIGQFLRGVDTILWGRKTYDIGRRLGGAAFDFGLKFKNYVFSRRRRRSSIPAVEFVREPVGDFARSLRARPGKDIWMMGGAQLIASFLDAGEIDEFIIHVVPVFIGDGIPLIRPRHRLTALNLRSATRFADGVVRLHYSVARKAGSGRNAPLR